MDEMELKRSRSIGAESPGNQEPVRNPGHRSHQDLGTLRSLVSVLPSANENMTMDQKMTSPVDLLSLHERVVQLDVENSRLKRLVTELLIRNQQLREKA